MPPCLPASLRDSFCAAANPYQPLSVRCRGQHLARYGLVDNAAIGHDGLLATMHNSQIEHLIRLNTPTRQIGELIRVDTYLFSDGPLVCGAVTLG